MPEDQNINMEIDPEVNNGVHYTFELNEEETGILINGGDVILDENHDLYVIIDDDYTVYFSNDPDNYKVDQTNKVKEEFFNGSEIALQVWKDKYAHKERSPSATFERFISAINEVEKRFPNPVPIEKIRDLSYGFKKIVPGGSIISGIGTKSPVSLANCFVINGPYDSYGGILHTDQEQVQLMKRRGGVGFDLSRIRPNGANVNNSAKTSTGLIPFAERFSNSTMECAQEGRRGALMLTLDAEHNQAIDFITAKKDQSKINGANISLRMSNHFLEKAFPKDDIKKNGLLYHVSAPGDFWSKDKASPKEVIDLVSKMQYESAEPGILFWDRIVNESPADCYDGFNTVSTNPCGEVPLSQYDSCRLLHMNVFAYVDKPFTKEAEFLFDEFSKDVMIAMRFLDDVVCLEEEKINMILDKIKNYDPEPIEIKKIEIELWEKIKDSLLKGRRVALGQTGMADALAALGMKYASGEAINFMYEVQKELAVSAYKSSIQLAKERGPFPVFSHSAEHDHVFLERIFSELDDEKEWMEMYVKHGRRNINCLTIAPTGTVSLLTGTSSGIEPVFSIVHDRKIKNQQRKVGDPEFRTVRIVHYPFKMWYDINMREHTGIDMNEMTVEQIMELVPMSPYAESSAHEIDYESKIKMQGLLQKYVDHAISVTHNLPEKTSPERIKNLIYMAWQHGCKGFTVYRENSRQGILTTIKDGDDILKKISTHDAIKRPQYLDASNYVFTIKGEKYCVSVGELNGSPYEVFAFKIEEKDIKAITGAKNSSIVKERSKMYSLYLDNGTPKNLISGINKKMSPDGELTCRLISIGLRHGVDINYIYEQIHKPNTDINDFARAISRAFKKYLKSDVIDRKGETCPECGSKLVMQEGCITCSSCTFSRCG